MSLRIKAVVDKFVQELKEALDADIQDRIMKEREMQSYIEEREREVAEREAAWKAELSRREVIHATLQPISVCIACPCRPPCYPHMITRHLPVTCSLSCHMFCPACFRCY